MKIQKIKQNEYKVTIPISLVRKLKIKKGDDIQFFVENESEIKLLRNSYDLHNK